MAVVEQAVADAFRRAGRPDDFAPLGDRDCAGHDDAALEVALLDNIEQDLPLLGLTPLRDDLIISIFKLWTPAISPGKPWKNFGNSLCSGSRMESAPNGPHRFSDSRALASTAG